MKKRQCIESHVHSELCAVSVYGLGSASIVFRLKSVAYFGDGGGNHPIDPCFYRDYPQIAELINFFFVMLLKR